MVASFLNFVIDLPYDWSHTDITGIQPSEGHGSYTIILENDPQQAKRILTSMMKNVDNSLYRGIGLYLDGKLPIGKREGLGIAEGGVGLAYNEIYFENTPNNIQSLIKAVEKALNAGVKITGCTVHLVDVEVDNGPILMQAAVPIFIDDTPETIHERIQVQEHKIIVAAIALAASKKQVLSSS